VEQNEKFNHITQSQAYTNLVENYHLKGHHLRALIKRRTKNSQLKLVTDSLYFSTIPTRR